MLVVTAVQDENWEPKAEAVMKTDQLSKPCDPTAIRLILLTLETEYKAA